MPAPKKPNPHPGAAARRNPPGIGRGRAVKIAAEPHVLEWLRSLSALERGRIVAEAYERWKAHAASMSAPDVGDGAGAPAEPVTSQVGAPRRPGRAGHLGVAAAQGPVG